MALSPAQIAAGKKLKEKLPGGGAYVTQINVPTANTAPKVTPTPTFQAPKTTAPTYTAPKTTSATNTTASIAPATPVVEQEAPTWIGKGPVGGGSGSGVTSSDYYQQQLDAQQAAIQQRINAAVEQNNAYIPQVNQRSDQSLQNAYILREQNRVNAPQALSALGYNGGAAESSLMGINTGYENTRNTVEQNRSQSLDEIYQNEQQIRATGDATLSEASADYYNKLVQAQQAAEANQREQMQWEAEYGLKEKEYEDAAAQQAWQNAYDERLLGLKQQSSGGSKSSTGGAAPETATNSAYYSTADRMLSTLSVPSSMTALIRQYNSDGRLSDEEATALLRKYGLTW